VSLVLVFLFIPHSKDLQYGPWELSFLPAFFFSLSFFYLSANCLAKPTSNPDCTSACFFNIFASNNPCQQTQSLRSNLDRYGLCSDICVWRHLVYQKQRTPGVELYFIFFFSHTHTHTYTFLYSEGYTQKNLLPQKHVCSRSMFICCCVLPPILLGFSRLCPK
jgi:hypothetical protein